MWKFSLLKKSEKFWHGVYSGFLMAGGFVGLIAFQNCSKSLKAKVSDQASKVTDGQIRPQQAGDCALEDGTILPEFSSRYFYSRFSVNANESCDSFKSPSPRKCIKGSLNGDASYSSPSCGVSVSDVVSTGGRGSCSSDGVTANEGEVGEFFLSNLSSEAQPCQSVQVACVKSGNVYKFAFENGQSYFTECNPGASCIDPSNTSSKISFPNGAKVNFSNRQVSTSEQPCSESDVKQRLCVDGNWSPAEYADYKYFDSTNYENTYGGCVAATPKDCKVENVVTATKTNSQLDETFSDLSIKNGSSVTVYDGPDCSSSKSIQLTCNNSVVNPLPSGKLYKNCINPNDLKPLYMGLIDEVGVSDDVADNKINNINIPIKRITISGWACQVSTSPSAKEQEIRILFNSYKESEFIGPQSLYDYIGAIDDTVNNTSLNTPFVPTSETEYANIKNATTESCYRNGGTANQPNIRFAKEFYVGPDGATKGTPNKVISETTYKTYFEDQLILSRISSNATYSNNIRTGFAFSPPNSKDVFLKPFPTNNIDDKKRFPVVTLSNSPSGSSTTTTTQPASAARYLGFLESSYVRDGKTYIGGWACKEGSSDVVDISIYVKTDAAGTHRQIGNVKANILRNGFNTAYQNRNPCGLNAGERHGFEMEITNEMVGHVPGRQIFAQIDISPGNYSELPVSGVRPVVFKMENKPVGRLDAIGNSQNKKVSGWAYDTSDLRTKVDVHFYQCASPTGCTEFPKGFLGLLTANRTFVDADKYTGALEHRFDGAINQWATAVSTPGDQYICAYAINPRTNGENTLLGCQVALRTCDYYKGSAATIAEYVSLVDGLNRNAALKTYCSNSGNWTTKFNSYDACVIEHIDYFGPKESYCNK